MQKIDDDIDRYLYAMHKGQVAAVMTELKNKVYIACVCMRVENYSYPIYALFVDFVV